MARIPTEAERRTEAVDRLLEEMRTDRGIRGAPAWWDHTFVRLDGRTPTEALQAGDESQVRALVDHWYEESETGAERHRQNPEFVKMIRAKSPAPGTGVLREWAQRDNPRWAEWDRVERWVLGLDANPFQPPSVSWISEEGEPYDIRSAQGEELGPIVIYYRVVHHDLRTDLLWVGPP